MPRFKATPQQFYVASDSDETESDDSSAESDEDEDSLSKNRARQPESGVNHEEVLLSPEETNSPSISQSSASPNLPTACLSTLQTAALLAQAAAVVAIASVSPIPNVTALATPPITPLGLPQLPVLNVQPTVIPRNSVQPKSPNIALKQLPLRKAPAKIDTELSPEPDTKSPRTQKSVSSSEPTVQSPAISNDSLSLKPVTQSVQGPAESDASAISEPIVNSPLESDEKDLLRPDEKSASESDEVSTAEQTIQFSSKLKSASSERRPLPIKKKKKKSHTKDREFINCSKCNKRMRKGSLREHMDRHNNSGKFTCTICPKTFSRYSALEKHIRTHTGERPYKCQLCSNSYRQRVHLNEHMRSHTGARPFICRLCGFSLASKSLLNRHLRTHGVPRHADDATEFWYKSNVNGEETVNIAGAVGLVVASTPVSESNRQSRHLATALTLKDGSKLSLQPTALVKGLAEQGRKYLCESCPAGFPTIQALRSHRMTMHGVFNPHKCPYCNESFCSFKILAGHQRDKHPQICPLCMKQMSQRKRCVLEAHIRDEHPGTSITEVLGLPLPPSKKSSSPRLTELSQIKAEGSLRSSKRPLRTTSIEIPKWKRSRAETNRIHSSDEAVDESASISEGSEGGEEDGMESNVDSADKISVKPEPETSRTPGGSLTSQTKKSAAYYATRKRRKSMRRNSNILTSDGEIALSKSSEAATAIKCERKVMESHNGSLLTGSLQKQDDTTAIESTPNLSAENSDSRARTESGRENATEMREGEDGKTEETDVDNESKGVNRGVEPRDKNGNQEHGRNDARKTKLSNGVETLADSLPQLDAGIKNGLCNLDKAEEQDGCIGPESGWIVGQIDTGDMNAKDLGTEVVEENGEGRNECTDDGLSEAKVKTVESDQNDLPFKSGNTINSSRRKYRGVGDLDAKSNEQTEKGELNVPESDDISVQEQNKIDESTFCLVGEPVKTKSKTEVDTNFIGRTNQHVGDTFHSADRQEHAWLTVKARKVDTVKGEGSWTEADCIQHDGEENLHDRGKDFNVSENVDKILKCIVMDGINGMRNGHDLKGRKMDQDTVPLVAETKVGTKIEPNNQCELHTNVSIENSAKVICVPDSTGSGKMNAAPTDVDGKRSSMPSGEKCTEKEPCEPFNIIDDGVGDLLVLGSGNRLRTVKAVHGVNLSDLQLIPTGITAELPE
ncbi:unnamed protein product [Calicophoron daubneyi]|uniref:C2H2-type domain-containing protein n=1 Tax=Calicophoron daubneyi TaxID=300641 RepID=A0AAV2TEY5_CALDB